MLWFIIVLLFVGIIAGFIARAVVPGDDSMSLAGTWLLGVIGSFVGGFLGHVLFDRGDDWFQLSGVLGSILGAIVALMVYRVVQGKAPIG